MGSRGKAPDTRHYNAFIPAAKAAAEKRGRRQGPTLSEKTKRALAELASVESIEDFRAICEAQARKRERDGY